MARGGKVPATEPQVIVTPPPPASFATAAAAGVSGAGAEGTPRVRGPGPGQGRAAQGEAVRQPPNFFNRGRQDGGLKLVHGRQPRQDSSSSAGKRQRTDEEGGWQEQRPYRSNGRQQHAARPKAQVLKGSSTEFAELAGPVTWWVGRCRPEVNEDKVKEVLTKLAEKCGVTDFSVESVHSLTKDPHPWSRSFKVCVPAQLEEQMRNPQMYPASWESRAFTQWPSRQQKGSRGPRLQEAPRAEGPQAQEALRVEGLQLQEDAPLGDRQVEPMLVAGAALVAAGGEAPKL